MVGAWRCMACPAKAWNICRPLDEDRLPELVKHAAVHHWSRRQMLFRIGDPAAGLHKITAGMVSLSKPMPDGRRQIVDFLMAGDIAGFMQSGDRYVFDCQAVTETTTCSFDRNGLSAVVARHQGVAAAMEKMMEDRVMRFADHMAAIGQMGATARLAYFLEWLSKEYGKRGLPAEPLALPMSRTDLADFLGLRFETVSRSFKELKDKHVLEAVSSETVVVTRSIGTSRSGAHLN